MKWLLTLTAVSLLFLAAPMTVQAQEVELATYTPEQNWERAASQVTVMGVAAIAYAKSLGQSVEAYTQTLSDVFAPGWGEPGSGSLRIVRGMHRNFSLWPDCEFEIVEQSETFVTVRGNRPWAQYFGEDQVWYGVTLDEYEKSFQLFNSKLAEYLGLGYEAWAEDDWQYMKFSLKN